MILIGRLIKDPVAKMLPNGSEVALFTVATSHTWKDSKTKEKKEAVEFHSVIAWGKLAKVVNKYLKKGSQVYLEGRLKTRSWEDKNGQKHYRTEMLVAYMIMLGGGSKKSVKPQDEIVEEVPVIEYED